MALLVTVVARPSVSQAAVPDGTQLTTNSAGDKVMTFDLNAMVQAATGVSLSALPASQREHMDEVIAEMNSEGIADYLQAAVDKNPIGAATIEAPPVQDIDATLARQGNNLLITVPQSEVDESASWWVSTLLVFAVLPVNVVVGGGCLYLTAGAYAPACSGLGTFFMVLSYNWAIMAIDHKFLDPQAQLQAVVTAVAWGLTGAGAGAAFGKYILPFAQRVRPVMTTVTEQIVSRVPSSVGSAVGEASDWVIELVGTGEDFAEDVENELARLGAGGSPSSVRLLPVGDSITFGVGSTDFNGYREDLYNDLSQEQLKPDFVGTKSSGDMSDPQNEGNRGWVIDQIADPAAEDAKKMRPNVVTLMAGTNDIQTDLNVATAPDRLNTLIDRVQAGSPGVAIAVATIVPVKGDPPAETRREAYNKQVRALVAERQNRREKVALAEMGPMTDAMLSDRLHPNDTGYDYMAKEFFDTVMKMIDWGWVQEPAPADTGEGGAGTKLCPNTGGGWTELGRIAQGPINSDSSSAGVQGEVRLADFDGNGKTDYAIVTDTGAVYLWTKITGGWVNRGKVAAGNGVAGRGAQVRFADIDGDHDADYLVVHSDGSVEAWRNDDVWVNGQSAWHAMGTIAAGTGTGGGMDIHFADIDGDLDDDYLVVHDDGSIDAWINDDVFANGGSAWKKLGRISGGVGYPGSKVRLADLDGDKDADYLIVHSDGSTEAWLNKSVAEDLREGWESIGKIATGTGTGGEAVQFADADADRDADYFVIGSAGTATWWQNDDVATRADKENGFKKVGVYGDHKLDASNNARSVTFADLDGDGDDDYLLVGPKGEVEAWRNDDVATRGTNAWIKIGRVAEGVSPGTTERVVFADIDGDGDDDYLVVDNTNGRVRGWRNDGPFTKGITAWTSLGVIAQGPAGAGESEVQFADIDGDGDDDYLLVSVDHSVRAWKNNGTNAPGGGGWAAQGLLAQPQSATVTQKTVFANMNCDKRADYVLRDPGDNNALYGWMNLGGFGNQWSAKKKIAYGVAWNFPVEVHLADLDGDGLDDYLVVDPTNGATRAWLNNGGNQANP